MPTPARRPAAGQRPRRRPAPGRRPVEPPARRGAPRRAAPLRRAARRPRRAGAQHPLEPAQGARGRGPPGRPAVLDPAPPGHLRAHRAAAPSWPARCGSWPSGARRVSTDRRGRRCTTPRAAPPSRPAGGVPPAPASSTRTRTPSSTGCEPLQRRLRLGAGVGRTWIWRRRLWSYRRRSAASTSSSRVQPSSGARATP